MHEKTPPTQKELDAILEERTAAHKKYCEARETFLRDFNNRKSALNEKKAATQAELEETRERHDAAMHALGVATVEGTNEQEATAAADELGAKMYALEVRAGKLATLQVKEDAGLFDAVIKAFQENYRTDQEKRRALYDFAERAEQMAKEYENLAQTARNRGHYGTARDTEMVSIYESVKGPMPERQENMKIHAILNM